MISFAWMKILESAPQRYDLGIRMLSGGRIEAVYKRISELTAAPGKRIVDIGCGTGGVSLACAARGASVTGIDIDAGMLEVARNKPAPTTGSAEFLEFGAAEIEDHFAAQSVDAVVSCLALSEMSAAEQDYALRAAYGCLVRGGVIVIADEVVPAGGLARTVHWLLRIPIIIITYLITQTTTRPVHDLSQRIRAAGFADIVEERLWSGSFLIVHARKAAS